jgi:hypothetical protein
MSKNSRGKVGSKRQVEAWVGVCDTSDVDSLSVLAPDTTQDATLDNAHAWIAHTHLCNKKQETRIIEINCTW